MQLLGKYSIRMRLLTLAAGLCLSGIGVTVLQAQSQTATPPAPSPSTSSAKPTSQEDNPFPGEGADAPKAPTPNTPAAGQSGAQKPGQQDGNTKPGTAKPESDNPFPGEDTNAPIIPVDPGPTPGAAPGSGSGAGKSGGSGADSAGTRRRDEDGDPVRSPDGAGNSGSDDGFSSSRSGLNGIPAEDDNDGRPGKSTKNKTREQVIKEDLDVGGFYMDRKNWKAAQARYSSAFALDAENPDAVWGLAEAERHLQLYKEAAEHYKLFLSYDPDGPHSKAGRKALEEVEAQLPATSAATKLTGPASNSPK
jgi:hypothetical protein